MQGSDGLIVAWRCIRSNDHRSQAATVLASAAGVARLSTSSFAAT
jgi:hypothetical protein